MKLTNVFHLFNGKGRLPPTSYMARCANQTQSLGVGLFVLMVPVCIILKAETDRMQTAEFYREQHEYRKGAFTNYVNRIWDNFYTPAPPCERT